MKKITAENGTVIMTTREFGYTTQAILYPLHYLNKPKVSSIWHRSAKHYQPDCNTTFSFSAYRE